MTKMKQVIDETFQVHWKVSSKSIKVNYRQFKTKSLKRQNPIVKGSIVGFKKGRIYDVRLLRSPIYLFQVKFYGPCCYTQLTDCEFQTYFEDSVKYERKRIWILFKKLKIKELWKQKKMKLWEI